MARGRWIITIHVTGRPRQVEVLLYDRLQDLRAAATRYVRQWETTTDDFSETLAVVHGFRKIRIRPDGSEEEHPLAAIIRFPRRGLTTLVVAHEVMHAVAGLYGFDLVKDGDLAIDHLDSGNEDIAELYGELFDAVWPLVHDAVDQAKREVA
jgi:hypothetical protein